MSIVELVKQGKFVVSAEVGPPKGVDIQEMLETVELMRDRVDAINVTDQQSSAMRLGSLATCRLLKEKGLESVFQVTCRDRNRIALQSDLLSAYVLGIFSERCRACGNCLLADYGGICPITMCAKSLVNGPCGGYKDGKCETSSERNCAWIMIYERLAKQGKLDKMREISTLKDYSVQSHPARQINEAYTKAKVAEAKA